MSQVQQDNTKPCNPFIDFNLTTTTSTTTQPPSLEYFLLPPSGSTCPQDPCVCGTIFVPIGSKFSSSGSMISIHNAQIPLAHNSNVFLEKEQIFITTTVKLPTNLEVTNYVKINLGSEVNLINSINVIVKIRETQKIIGQAIIGSFDSNMILSEVYIPLIDTFNLANLTLQLEFISLCKNFKTICCDKLPSSISLSNVVNTIFCTTTSTTTTLPPFCSQFNLPDSFYVTVIGYGLLSGQEKYSLVTRNGNTWSTYGSFYCGANFYISMTCNSATQRFVYDGYIDCCIQQTKTVINPTTTPYIYPQARLPQIISYGDCICAKECSPPTTTTTTTTDFPTTPPPRPPVPCSQDKSLTINGYAFYRNSQETVDIPGIGNLTAPCYGGHWCNNTDFIPQLITPSATIVASPISMNNGSTGANVTQTFTFNIEDSSILKGGVSMSLKCISSGGCHNGVTWIVLTTQIDDQTVILFNSCVVPNSLDSLDIECIDCCQWNGDGSILFNNNCDGLTTSIKFYKIGDNLWECDTTMDCGDKINMIIKCNKDVEFDSESPNLDQLCKQKWEVINFSLPCAVNPRITGNLLTPCECDKPPVFEFTFDSINTCECCTFEADFLVLQYLFTDGNDLDTRTSISASSENGSVVGWCRGTIYNGTGGTWYQWGGDNTGVGYESVLIDVSRIREAYPNTNIVGRAAAMWFGQRISGNVTLNLLAYKGGTMSKTGFTWDNIDGELTSSISITKNIALNIQNCNGEEIVSFFTYTANNQLLWSALP